MPVREVAKTRVETRATTDTEATAKAKAAAEAAKAKATVTAAREGKGEAGGEGEGEGEGKGKPATGHSRGDAGTGPDAPAGEPGSSKRWLTLLRPCSDKFEQIK